MRLLFKMSVWTFRVMLVLVLMVLEVNRTRKVHA